MTFEEAKAALLAEREWDKQRGRPDARVELLLALVAEIERLREIVEPKVQTVDLGTIVLSGPHK